MAYDLRHRHTMYCRTGLKVYARDAIVYLLRDKRLYISILSAFG